MQPPLGPQVCGMASHSVPPQSTSVSLPFCTASLHDAGVQVPAQTLLVQSPLTAQAALSEQRPHEPPQSTSVSPPFWMPSVHDAGTHVPLPLHNVPPLSLQVVPVGALVVAQVLPL